MSKDDYPPVVQGVPTLTAGKTEGCVCHGCGTRYTVDLLVPDALWAEIKPGHASNGGGLLCGSCIMTRIEGRTLFGAWQLIPI